MNPKGTSNLDPKLRETYERVMGTTFPPSPSQPLKPASPAPEQKTAQPIFTSSAVTNPASNPIPNPAIEMVQSPSFKAVDPFADLPPLPAEILAKDAVVNPGLKKKSKLMPVIFIFGGTVFFIIYVAVWAKVFGLF